MRRETQSGGYFNDQERDVTSLQWVEALQPVARPVARRARRSSSAPTCSDSHYDGESLSRPVEIRRLDGSLAERTDVRRADGAEASKAPSSRCSRRTAGASSSRLTFEFGLRIDRDAVVERVNWSPRGGVAVSVLPEGRGILRGGFGKFVQRTPLNVDAFPSFEPRTVTRFEPTARLLGRRSRSPTRRRLDCDAGGARRQRRMGSALRPPLAAQGRVSPRAADRTNTFSRPTSGGELRLSSTGTSRYRELETTGAVPRRRAARPDALVRVVARHRRSQQLRPVLRQLPQSDHPRRTRTT